jgi:glucokinase
MNRLWNGARFVLDMGGTCIRSGRVDEKGSIESVSFFSERITASLATRWDLRDLLVNKIVSLGAGQESYVLSFAGPVSSDNRTVRKYTNVLPDDADIPIADMVEEEVRRQTGKSVHCTVVKDAVAATIAEMGPRGSAAGRDLVIAVILGTGTGGAPCRRGHGGVIVPIEALADLGHYRVDPQNTDPCNCGSCGCVEQQTSGTAVMRSANRAALKTDGYEKSRLWTDLRRRPGQITCEDIAWGAARQDSFVLQVLRAASRSLSLLLRCIFTSHPDMTVVLVGGFALALGGAFVGLLVESLTEYGVPFVDRRHLPGFLDSRILLGAVPPEETNLVGARHFLLQEERRQEGSRPGIERDTPREAVGFPLHTTPYEKEHER